MFYRNILKEMRIWAEQRKRKPLILRGARQVGKTTMVELFSKEFDQYLSFNLEKREDAGLFEQDLSVHELVEALFFYKNQSRKKGKILLFIDEIQECTKAIPYLRYFYESVEEIHVIAAGSLLEIMLGDRQISFPVGRVQYLFMHPFSFEEFLAAFGDDQALQLFRQIPLPSFAFPKLLHYFHRYAQIGGMPEIVAHYCQNQDLTSLIPLYQGLFTSYFDDVSKYGKNNSMPTIIRHTIEAAPREAGKRIKFQGFGNSNYKSKEIGEAIKSLERAMLISLIYPTTALEVPPLLDYKKSPKLQFLDTGLMNYSVGLQGHFYQMEDLHSFYQGILAEHLVGQELLALNRYVPNKDKIAFWVREKKQSNAEVDFVIPYQGNLIPVEVKSGKSGTLRSLHQFIDAVKHSFAIRLYAGPLVKMEAKTPAGTPYTLLNLPYFLASLVNEYIEYYFKI